MKVKEHVFNVFYLQINVFNINGLCPNGKISAGAHEYKSFYLTTVKST